MWSASFCFCFFVFFGGNVLEWAVLRGRTHEKNSAGKTHTHLVAQAALDGEGLVQKALVKRLLRLGDHHDGDARAVVLRPPGAAHHLQHVRDREVDVAARRGVVELGALDDDEVRGRVDAPRERARRDQDLDLLGDEEALDERAVGLGQAGVVQADAKLQRVAQRRVAHLGERGLFVLFFYFVLMRAFRVCG